MQLSSSSFAGVRVEVPQKVARPSRAALQCRAVHENASRRNLLGAGLLWAATIAVPSAKADLIEDLLAKSEANKALNDRKRLATSYANFARSRTLNDGTCQFPQNFFGCDVKATAGDVKFITDDMELECQGNSPGECAEKPNMFGIIP